MLTLYQYGVIRAFRRILVIYIGVTGWKEWALTDHLQSQSVPDLHRGFSTDTHNSSPLTG